MLSLHYHPSPNPDKVALCLEEMGLGYTMVPVDTRKGEQHASAFRAINPNGKTPALVDPDSDATLFDSNAILLYLAEKTGRFAPGDPLSARGELFSWLMFVATGVGPYSGQAVHFRHAAPAPQDYAVNRYTREAERHWSILDERLAGQAFILGEEYTIVDMAVWGWAERLPFVLGEDAWDHYPNVARLHQTVSDRPAAQRARTLKERHAFKMEMDEQAKRAKFPQNYAAS
jgi:GST-like protein